LSFKNHKNLPFLLINKGLGEEKNYIDKKNKISYLEYQDFKKKKLRLKLKNEITGRLF